MNFPFSSDLTATLMVYSFVNRLEVLTLFYFGTVSVEPIGVEPVVLSDEEAQKNYNHKVFIFFFRSANFVKYIFSLKLDF